MAATFFKKIPKIQYNFIYSGKEETLDVKNISIKHIFSNKTKKGISGLYSFYWVDNLRPDSFAELYYGMNELYWLGLFSGGIYDVHNELPRNDRQLLAHNFLKYKEDPQFLIWKTQNSKRINEESIFEYMSVTPGRVVDKDGDIIKEGIGSVAKVVSTNNISPLSGNKNIEGVSVGEGENILLVSQSNSSENGVYLVKNGSWVKLDHLNYVLVQQGTHQGSIWDMVHTNPLTFVKMSNEYIPVSLMEISEKDNEAKRYINIIDNSFGPKFRAEYDSAMNKLQVEIR